MAVEDDVLLLQNSVNQLIETVNNALTAKLQWQQVNAIVESELETIKADIIKLKADVAILKSFHV